jgi:hypothetical protein
VIPRAIAASAALVAALVVASSASAAAPNYIMVTGHGLARPVLLANWSENLRLLVAVANAPRAKGAAVRGLSRRPRFDLAEFWNWSYLPRPTRPSEANQHGMFYPAHGGRPPVIVITVDGTNVPRLLPAAVLQIFRRHGVPTRL